MRKLDLAVLVLVIAVASGAVHHRSVWTSSSRTGSSESRAILNKKCYHNRKLCDALSQFYVATARGELRDQRAFDTVSDPIFQLVTRDKDLQETPSGLSQFQAAEATLQKSSEHLYESFYALQATQNAKGDSRGKLLTKAHQELQWGQTLSIDAIASIESH